MLGGIFQNRDFRLLWFASGVDNLGRWLEVIALALLVLELTDSPWWVALLGVMRVTPMLVFGMVSGIIADRVDRWRVMVIARITKVAATAVLLALIASDSIEPWHALLGILVTGWAHALDMPSRHSFIFDLVGPENTTRAMSLESFQIPVGMFVGPLLAGLFIELTGYTGAYVFLLSVYIIALILISRIGTRIARRTIISQPLWQSLVSGLRYTIHVKPILGVLIITLIMNLMAFSTVPLFPVVARDHLEVGAGLTGVLISAVGMGFLLGSATIAVRGVTRFHGCLFVLGAIWLFVGLLSFSLSPWYLVSFVALLVYGVGQGGFTTMQSTIVLMSSAPEMRGRAMGLLVICIGAGPLGMLEVGAVATILDPQEAISINAAIGFLMLVPVMALMPFMWRPLTTKAVGPAVPRAASAVSPLPRPDDLEAEMGSDRGP